MSAGSVPPPEIAYATLPGAVAPPHPMADPPAEAPAPPRERVRGLQLRKLPTVPLVAQVLGGGAALYGVWQTWGAPVAFVVGGVATVVLGMLREGGKI